MRFIRVLVLMVALVAVSAAQAAFVHAQAANTAPAGDLPADRHKQVDAIFAPWSGTTTPGCSVAISRDGVLDYARGYGMANLEYDIALTPDSIFDVASVSKQFTAFAIGLLAQEGKLSLEDDVRKYVPELADYGHKVTLAHLLHHTAGMREEAHLLYLAGWRSGDWKTDADVLRILTKQRAPNFAPGAEVVYSNSHYALLATVVTRVSGMPLRRFAEERIFKPLGMTDTRFPDGHTEVVRRRASGYSPAAGGGWRVSVSKSDNYGAGNLLTTVGDLLKWEENLLHARVGGRALADMMQASGTLNGGLAIRYGGGLRLGRYRGLRTVGHDGSAGGFRAGVIAFPERRFVIAMLCNNGAIAPDEIIPRMADVYLGDRPAADTRTTVKVPDAELSALAGTYWNALFDGVLRLEAKDGTIRVVGSPETLEPIGHGVFRVNGVFGSSGLPYEWRFIAPAGAPANAPRELQIWESWPTPRIFTRLTAPVPSAAALAAYAGQYRSEDVDMTYTVSVENGRLSVRWARGSAFTLEAVGGDHFSEGGYTVTFTRAASGEVDGLTFSTRRVRRLRAERLAAPAPASATARAPRKTS